MKCDICGTEKDKIALVTYHYINGNFHTSRYCVYRNSRQGRYQIRHRGLIQETRNMAEGNITYVEIKSVGYDSAHISRS